MPDDEIAVGIEKQKIVREQVGLREAPLQRLTQLLGLQRTTVDVQRYTPIMMLMATHERNTRCYRPYRCLPSSHPFVELRFPRDLYHGAQSRSGTTV